MYAKIEWTSYRFDPPRTISEEIYLVVKNNPAEFRQYFVNAHLIRGFKRVALNTLLCWGLGAGFVGIAYWLDLNRKGGWGEGLAIGGMAAGVSGIYTAGSFLKYAVNFRQFWRRVVVTARETESYSDFLPLVAKCKSSGLNREIPWWLVLIVLVVPFLLLYVALRLWG
jgi:hypothetical protein